VARDVDLARGVEQDLGDIEPRDFDAREKLGVKPAGTAIEA